MLACGHGWSHRRPRHPGVHWQRGRLWCWRHSAPLAQDSHVNWHRSPNEPNPHCSFISATTTASALSSPVATSCSKRNAFKCGCIATEKTGDYSVQVWQFDIGLCHVLMSGNWQSPESLKRLSACIFFLPIWRKCAYCHVQSVAAPEFFGCTAVLLYLVV